MVIEKGIEIMGSNGRPMSTDVIYQNDQIPKTIVLYLHGFNGFKDWGNFDLIAQKFALAGYFFCKFNFSHNGTTPQHPEEFVDLEAYGQNTYSKEIADTHYVIDWFKKESNPFKAEINPQKIVLLGHSRGGGIALISAWQRPEVKGVVTWASVCECKTPWGNWTEESIKIWKESGVAYYENKRTSQKMPLFYSLYEDYQNHKSELNIEQACSQLDKPYLICHGTKDEAVPWQAAESLHQWSKKSTLFLSETDHVFGRKHPNLENSIPAACNQMIEKSIQFLNENNFGLL